MIAPEAPTKPEIRAPKPVVDPEVAEPVPPEEPASVVVTKRDAVEETVVTEEATEEPAPEAAKVEKPAQRGDRAFFVAAGRSRSRGSVDAIAFGLEFFSSQTWFDGGNWYCSPFLELLGAYWEGDAGHTGVTSLHEAGISGYIRCIRKPQPGGSIRPYADVGLGVHYVTEDRIEGKELGRQWLVGSNVGIGLVLGESERFDVGLRIRHLSNGGTRDINWGINHYMVRAAVRF